eukprot:8767618-Pyramimonas_sp.AAC.1
MGNSTASRDGRGSATAPAADVPPEQIHRRRRPRAQLAAWAVAVSVDRGSGPRARPNWAIFDIQTSLQRALRHVDPA